MATLHADAITQTGLIYGAQTFLEEKVAALKDLILVAHTSDQLASAVNDVDVATGELHAVEYNALRAFAGHMGETPNNMIQASGGTPKPSE